MAALLSSKRARKFKPGDKLICVFKPSPKYGLKATFKRYLLDGGFLIVWDSGKEDSNWASASSFDVITDCKNLTSKEDFINGLLNG